MHQELVGVTSAILVTEQAPTLNTMVLGVQCATVLTRTPLPLQGTTVSAPLLVQRTSVGVRTMFIPFTVLPPVTRAPIPIQGMTFLPVASAPMLFLGVARAPAPNQSAALPPMAGALLLSHCTPYPGLYMAAPAWLMYMPSFLPRPQMEPSSQSEHELLAIQRRGRLKI